MYSSLSAFGLLARGLPQVLERRPTSTSSANPCARGSAIELALDIGADDRDRRLAVASSVSATEVGLGDSGASRRWTAV